MIKNKDGLALTGKGDNRRWRRVASRVEIGPKEQQRRRDELKKQTKLGLGVGLAVAVPEILNTAYINSQGQRMIKDKSGAMGIPFSQKQANKDAAKVLGSMAATRLAQGSTLGALTKHLEHRRHDSELNRTARKMGYTSKNRMKVG